MDVARVVPSLSRLVLSTMIRMEIVPGGHLRGSPVVSFLMKVKPQESVATTRPASARARILAVLVGIGRRLGLVRGDGGPDLGRKLGHSERARGRGGLGGRHGRGHVRHIIKRAAVRSEEHTSELQSRQYLVCRLL